MTTIIKAIEKGWDENSTYYSTDEKVKGRSQYVDEIRKEQRQHFVGESDSGCVDIIVYRGYLDGNMMFEIESGSSVSLFYKEVQP